MLCLNHQSTLARSPTTPRRYTSKAFLFIVDYTKIGFKILKSSRSHYRDKVSVYSPNPLMLVSRSHSIPAHSFQSTGSFSPIYSQFRWFEVATQKTLATREQKQKLKESLAMKGKENCRVKTRFFPRAPG